MRARAEPAAIALIAVSLLLWLIPSDVVRLVANQRHVFLGRYSIEWLTALLCLTPSLWVTAWVLAGLRRGTARARARRLALVAGSVLFATLAVDVAARSTRAPRYAADARGERGVQRHRQADRSIEVRVLDDPTPARSYPHAPRGYPPLQVTLTTDARGYRNRRPPTPGAIVAIGDSFTEGSHVSDEQSWPARLERALGAQVYNLGASGTDPEQYRRRFEALALPLRTRTAIVMLYEGNDFKAPRPHGSAALASLRDTLEASPVVRALERALERTLGPVAAGRPIGGDEIWRWMPVTAPRGSGNAYAFKPKRLLRLDVDRETFERSRGFARATAALRDMRAAAQRAGVDLRVVLAPSKPHVVLPLVRDTLPPEGLRAFADLEADALPEPVAYRDRVFERLDTAESSLRAYCARNEIPFLGLTAALRRAADSGRHVYFAYDQHWTPEGHAIASREIAAWLGAEPGLQSAAASSAAARIPLVSASSVVGPTR